MQPRVLLDGLAMPESPRWPEGRLWFSNWGTRQIVAVDLDGNSDVVGEGPDGLGWATNWLPDVRHGSFLSPERALSGAFTSRRVQARTRVLEGATLPTPTDMFVGSGPVRGGALAYGDRKRSGHLYGSRSQCLWGSIRRRMEAVDARSAKRSWELGIADEFFPAIESQVPTAKRKESA